MCASEAHRLNLGYISDYVTYQFDIVHIPDQNCIKLKDIYRQENQIGYFLFDYYIQSPFDETHWLLRRYSPKSAEAAEAAAIAFEFL